MKLLAKLHRWAMTNMTNTLNGMGKAAVQGDIQLTKRSNITE